MGFPAVLALYFCCSAFQVESSATVTPAGKVQGKSLDEASGLILSSRHDGVYWTHNDGDDGDLYAIRSDGTLVARIEVRERFNDWEDIAVDAKGNVFLADTGNNSRSRKTVTVHRISEPQLRGTKEVNALDTFRLTFPDKPFDCESLFIFADHAYLISKVPAGQRATLYRFPLTATKKKQVLEKVLTLPIEEQVTAADISRDGKRLAVLSDSAVFVLQIDGRIENAADAKPRRISIPSATAEGCCFTSGGVLVIAESGEIFRVRLDGPTTR